MPPPPEFDRLCIVLVSTRNPLNLGAAARAMSNFGILHLRVVNPYDLSFREARSGVGASDLLTRAEQFKTVGEAVADCTLVVGTTAESRCNLPHPPKPLALAASLIRKRFASGRVALLFGSEKRGLSNDDFSHCHWLLHIPTREAHRSINLGQAVAVCLYELARDFSPSSKPQKRRASASAASSPANLANAATLERLTSLLLDTLSAAGYLQAPRTALSSQKSAASSAASISLPTTPNSSSVCFAKSSGAFGLIDSLSYNLTTFRRHRIILHRSNLSPNRRKATTLEGCAACPNAAVGYSSGTHC